MFDELRKSTQLILTERITSPFSGAFILSWIVWNWRILYVLVAADVNFHLQDRIAWVQDHYLNWETTLVFPALSAALLVTLYPFVTTGSLWVWLKFKKLQRHLRNSIEEQQTLTIEESMRLRIQTRAQEERYDALLKSKEGELALVIAQRDALQKELTSNRPKEGRSQSSADQVSSWEAEYEKLSKNPAVFQHFPLLVKKIQDRTHRLYWGLPTDILAYFESNDIITSSGDSYSFTPKGKTFLRKYTDQRLS